MKKLLTILVLIMLIISFFQITRMYALYREEIQGEYSSLLGAWEIKVNGTNIISPSGQIERFIIEDNQLGYVASEYIQADKIAPGGQAYFDIVIDPANTDVSIVYTINVNSDVTNNANIELVSAEDYFKIDGQPEEVTNDKIFKSGNSYTGVIPVSKITQGYKDYVRLYFKWTNVDENNETDTQLSAGKISIPLQINLKQYMGEDIGNGS